MNATDTKTSSRTASSETTVRRLGILWARGTGIAIFAVAFVYTLADGLSGPLLVTGTGEVTLASVVIFTIIGGTAGAILAYAIGRFTRSPRRTFLTVTVIGVAGYAVVPLTAAESLDTAIWLNVLHLAVAFPVLWMLTEYLPKDRTSAEA